MNSKEKLLIIMLVSLALAGVMAHYFTKVEKKYEDSITLKKDSLAYVNKVKDSIIYDLYQENKQLKSLQ